MMATTTNKWSTKLYDELFTKEYANVEEQHACIHETNEELLHAHKSA